MDLLIKDIKKYIQYHYLLKQEKFFKVHITKNTTIGYHKIEIQSHERSKKHGSRMLSFFMHITDNTIRIIPVFVFSVQDEKKYTTNILCSPQFGKKLIQKLERLQGTDFMEILIFQT